MNEDKVSMIVILALLVLGIGLLFAFAIAFVDLIGLMVTL